MVITALKIYDYPRIDSEYYESDWNSDGSFNWELFRKQNKYKFDKLFFLNTDRKLFKR